MPQSYLNLIPTNHKQLLAREHRFYLVHNIVGILVVVLAANAILLTVARFILVDHFKELKEDTSRVNTRRSMLQSEIKHVNNRIAETAQLQTGFVKYTALLSDITAALPRGVTVDFLHTNTESNTFRVTGVADNRDALLAAKAALEKVPAVTSLESPLENFLERENIEFTFNGTIKQGAYQTPPED